MIIMHAPGIELQRAVQIYYVQGSYYFLGFWNIYSEL